MLTDNLFNIINQRPMTTLKFYQPVSIPCGLQSTIDLPLGDDWKATDALLWFGAWSYFSLLEIIHPLQCPILLLLYHY